MDDKNAKRSKQIVKASIIGIIANIILSIFKFIIGTFSSSIAITNDAINNLSDALSSVITIVGMKLATKPADKNHPFGHGRIEYLSTMAISFLVLFAGITSMEESIKKIITPNKTTYSTIMLIIIGVAILVKFFMGHYTKGVGKKVNSGSLIASGTDALFDAILSISTLISALITIIWDINFDGIIGAIIAVFIIKAGIEILINTMNDIVGTRVDPSFSKKLKAEIKAHDKVLGVHDLNLHSYGPENMTGSVHIDVSEDLEAGEIYDLTRNLTFSIFQKHGIFLTFGIYSMNTKDPKLVNDRSIIFDYVIAQEGVIDVHAIYINDLKKEIAFDVVISFKVEDNEKLRQKIKDHLEKSFKGYNISILFDVDISD